MTTTLLVGDVRERIKELPDESVHCVVTSPPYFGLRDYGMAAQIGLEPTPSAYVLEMVSLFREVRRVLRSDGTFWLNLGDSYNNNPSTSNIPRSQQGNGGGAFHVPGEHQVQARRATPNKATPLIHAGIKKKDRMMIPARVALALQADGWWLRDEIIWHKPNPMPVSVTDRTTPAHEMLYMFAKSARYHYDMEAVKEPITESSKRRYAQPRVHEQTGGEKQDAYEMAGITSGSRRPNEIVSSLAKQHKQDLAGNRQYTGFNARYFDGEEKPTLRQPRSVWTVTPKPFKGAHFATFPPDLIRPCVLAGCPIGGTVLDPFFGAGTTGLVAAELDRDCIGFELNPEYAQIARERLGLSRPSNIVDISLERFRAHVAAEIELRPALAALQARLRARG